MAALFTAASTQYLINSAPTVLDYPFTVGMWANLAAAGTVNRTLFALSDTGTTNNYLLVRMNTLEQFQTVAAAGGTENASGSSFNAVAGTWNFLLARFISSTNRRFIALNNAGVVASGNTSTARAPIGMDTITLGATSTSAGISDPWDGLIGEYWLANSDVYSDSAAVVDANLLRQLAYAGPFSMPQITSNLVEYHSFRKGVTSDAFNNEEDFLSGIGAGEVLANTNGVSIGHHPPLPYWYEKPGQRRSVLMI